MTGLRYVTPSQIAGGRFSTVVPEADGPLTATFSRSTVRQMLAGLRRSGFSTGSFEADLSLAVHPVRIRTTYLAIVRRTDATVPPP